MEEQVRELNDGNLESFIREKPVAVVDCWAEWCMPCLMMSPTVEQVAEDMRNDVAVGKLNVDTNQRTATRFGIMAIPTLLIFKNGELVDQMVGVKSRRAIEKTLQKWMASVFL
jgi:thioredoxin 1